jgi:hypothetical protein
VPLSPLSPFVPSLLFAITTASTAFGGGLESGEGCCHRQCRKAARVMMCEREGVGGRGEDIVPLSPFVPSLLFSVATTSTAFGGGLGEEGGTSSSSPP